jgi:hypothetical protein
MPRWAPWLASSLLLPAFLASAQPTSNDAKVVQTRDAARVLAVHLAHTPPTSPFAEDLESYRVEYRVPSATAVAAESVTFESQSASGETVDRLLVTSKRVECASEDGGACFASEPIRLVIDAVDKEHPLLERRSLIAHAGGLLRVLQGGRELLSVPVSGGAVETEASLRLHVFRVTEGGPVSLAQPAVVLAREIERAEAIWGACGIAFDEPDKQLAVHDPPSPFMLSVGCELPAPALGGTFSFRADGREFQVPVAPGSSPRSAARRVAAALTKAGFVPSLTDNPRPQGMSLGSTDLVVRTKQGKFAKLSASPSHPLSSDPALSLCVPEVDLSNGLRHFSDADSLVGTMEERLLVRSVEDGDPTTIEVLVIPAFRGEARIGESFIGLEHGAIRNVLIQDRAAFRVGHASFTLAHELGHILLDQPGHTDDFGLDTPTFLMDADAVLAGAFGPRRLSTAECERAYRQGRAAGGSGLLRAR